MAKRRAEQDSGELEGEGPDEGHGGPSLFDWARLVLGSVWRRKLITLSVFVLGAGASVAYLQTRRPTYRVETRILAQRQTMLPSAIKPTVQDDSPTRAAWDLVHRRSNILAIIKTAGLQAQPLPAEAAREAAGDPAEPGDSQLDLLIRRVDSAIKVDVEEGTITIAAEWPNPVQAFRIAETAMQNFLEARHVQEITAIDEVISVLRGRVSVLRANLDRVMGEVSREFGRESAPAPRATESRPAPASEETVRLRSLLEAKERAIQDLDEFRRRKQAELQAQLDEKKGIYSDAHPMVMSLKQEIAARSAESPQIAGLREEERALRQQYQARLAQDRAQGGTVVVAQAPSRMSMTTAVDEDERVRQARTEYQQLLGRVTAAEVDLDAARTAFKYRYSVIWPAEIPRKPSSPKPVKILGLGAVASLLMAFGVATLLELLSGRVVAAWQLEKGLDVPVLARIERKR